LLQNKQEDNLMKRIFGSILAIYCFCAVSSIGAFADNYSDAQKADEFNKHYIKLQNEQQVALNKLRTGQRSYQEYLAHMSDEQLRAFARKTFDEDQKYARELREAEIAKAARDAVIKNPGAYNKFRGYPGLFGIAAAGVAVVSAIDTFNNAANAAEIRDPHSVKETNLGKKRSVSSAIAAQEKREQVTEAAAK
jgi:hypothetical protein